MDEFILILVNFSSSFLHETVKEKSIEKLNYIFFAYLCIRYAINIQTNQFVKKEFIFCEFFFFLFLSNRLRLFAPNARRKIYGWRFFARPLCHRISAGRALSRLSIRHSVIFGDERKSKALRRRTVTPERVVIAEKTRGGQGRRGGRRAIRPGFSGVDEPNDPAPRETRFNCRKNQCFEINPWIL